jgi:hypothetical protein
VCPVSISTAPGFGEVLKQLKDNAKVLARAKAGQFIIV